MSRPFIPRDKPKSFVVFICAGLLGLLIFGPIAFLGGLREISAIYYLGAGGFVVCWTVMAINMLVFFVGLIGGKYRDLQPRAWKEQVW